MSDFPIPTPPRVLIQPGFRWDQQHAYLFDIDGTILRSRDRIHYNSFAHCVRSVTGLEASLTGINLMGHTDTGILRDAFLQSGHPAHLWEPLLPAILDEMRNHVVSRRAELNLIPMPAIEPTLQHLARQGALLGLATGNLEAIGWLKVEVLGLRSYFCFGGFSDNFEVRSEMIADAVRQARELLGPDSCPSPSICVVGDTPRDITAARANNLSVIAVATGNNTFDELAALQPEVCTTSLADLLAFTEAASTEATP
jgi:phosphoglycolate phosphatase